MEESVNQRIKIYLKKKNKSNKDAAIQLGMNDRTFTNKLNGLRTFNQQEIKKFALQNEDLNTNWLITGEGEMLKETSVTEPTAKGVPYFDTEIIACGTLTGFGKGLEKVRASGYIIAPQIPAREGDLFIQAQGRSMIDTVHTDKSIPSGSWVCIRKWEANYIQWGEIYAIATNEGFAIKKLLPSEREGYIKCVSSNEAEGYLPYELNMGTDVVDIARVIGVADFKVF